MLQPTHTLVLTPENRHLTLRDSIIGIDAEHAAVIWQPERGSGVYVTNIYAGDGPLTPDDLVALHDGSIPTLESMVQLMVRHQLGKELSSEQVDTMVIFLRSLTGELPADYTAAPELPLAE